MTNSIAPNVAFSLTVYFVFFVHYRSVQCKYKETHIKSTDLSIYVFFEPFDLSDLCRSTVFFKYIFTSF